MTAEIGILNKQGVALAADSAVTITSGDSMKVLNSANKLFNLSCYEPVGIMVYGNGNYMGTPWEIIIKQYRNLLGKKRFKTLNEYCNDFFDYVYSCQEINSILDQEYLVKRLFNERLEELLNLTNEELNKKFDTLKPKEDEVKEVLQNRIEEYVKVFSKRNSLDNFQKFTFEEYKEEYSDVIKPIIDNAINIKLDQKYIEKLKVVGYLSIVKDLFSNYTGVVVAGYGEDEIFPRIYDYYVCGSTKGFRKYKLNNSHSIGSGPFNFASINPFAQQEMVHSIVTGVDPNLFNEINSMIDLTTNGMYDMVKKINELNNLNLNIDKLEEVFTTAGNQINKEIKEHIKSVQQEKYIDPILSMVGMLPKDELATMAETLVNLTSFKRRITLGAETVGGPIDVAVISKNDGFIWIKRKHYFNPDLNYNYFNKKKGVCDYVSK